MKKSPLRILIVHQFMWAHYKANIYSELQRLVNEHEHLDLQVLQLSASEGTRTTIGSVDFSIHKYNVHLLNNALLEDLNPFKKFWQVFGFMWRYKPHVINLPGYYDMSMNMILLCAKLMGIKVIMANDSAEGDNKNVFWKELIKKFFVRLSNGFFCYGTLSAQYIERLGGKNILVKNNAVNNQAIRAYYEQALHENTVEETFAEKNFIYVGRFIPFKNLERLVRAFLALNQQTWGLILLGQGHEQANLEAILSQYPEAKVNFVPGKSWQEVPQYLAKANVFVLPSYSEPWGLVVNEAMVCGLPVLVSENCGSAIDLVKNGENGYSFSPFSQEELQEKLQLFIEKMPSELEAMGKSSQAIIEPYNPAQVAKEMLDGFVNIVK
jgi:glycosyltransferase involved in cell wall biosynthesis